MKLSVILPCYNVGRFVRLCLDSLAEAFALSSIDDYEIIVVDDGSSDDTADVVMQTGCKNLRLFRQKNSGLSGARNRGLSEAHGRWVWFVDPDDTVAPDILQKISHLLDSPYEAIAFGFNLCYPDGRKTSHRPLSLTEGEGEKVANRDEIFDCYVQSFIGYSQHNLDRLYAGLPISERDLFMQGTVWHYIFRKDVLEGRNVKFPSQVKLAEDMLFVSEYFTQIESLVAIDVEGYNYRVNADGLLFGSIGNPQRVARNKLAMAVERERVRHRVLQEQQIDLLPCFAASLVLSVVEMAAKGVNISCYLQYVQMENVRKSIELIDIRNAPLKYYLPFRMLKLGLYRTLYYLVRCSQVVLGNVSGRKSVFR